MGDNSVKYMIKVESWNFASSRNRLQIIMQNDGNSQNVEDNCVRTQSSVDGSNNLLWFNLNIDGVSLYLKYTNIIILRLQYYIYTLI